VDRVVVLRQAVGPSRFGTPEELYQTARPNPVRRGFHRLTGNDYFSRPPPDRVWECGLAVSQITLDP